MNHSRILATATIAATAALLTLTACGGDEDSSTEAGEGSSTDKSALVDDLMVLVAGTNAPNEGCLRMGLEDFSAEELQTLKDGADEPDVASGNEPLSAVIPADLQDKVTQVSDECPGTSSPTEMVPAGDGDPGTSVPPDGGP